MRQASARSVGFQQWLNIFSLPAATALLFVLFSAATVGLCALEVKREDVKSFHPKFQSMLAVLFHY